MATILGANTLSSGYDVANSCLFTHGDSSRMNKDLAAPTHANKATVSIWFKRMDIGREQHFFGTRQDGNDRCSIGFDDSAEGELHIVQEDSGSYSLRFKTTRRFRDPAAWYHLVLAMDTTQGTASNRVKIYINGTQETAFETETYPDQNDTLRYCIDGEELVVGAKFGGGGSYGNFFSGYLAEVVLIDGQQLLPTSFGEFDSDTPNVWKPIDVSGLTFGNNGCYLDFEDSSNLGNDANGGTDLSETNLAATDQMTDTCTNNFATLNPLFPEGNITISDGNLKVTADGSANWSSIISTIGLSSGKWYWEWTATSTSNAFAGLASEALVNSTLISDSTPYDQNGLILYFTDGRKTVDGSNTESHFTAWSSGTMSCALDLDSGTRTAKFYHNGSQTGDTINLTANMPAGADVFPVFMVNAGSNPSVINPNFGSPFYANSSDAADGNGYGAFEYAPPDGYYAVNTKNLAEYG